MYGQTIEIKCPEGSRLKTIKNRNERIYICTSGDTLNGPTFIYDKSGKLLEENYWNKGEKTGTWKTYWLNGKVKSKEVFDSTGIFSTQTFFYENGKRQTLTTFSKNKKNGRIAEWFPNGMQNTEGNFVDDVQDGIWMFRMPDLKTVTVVVFRKGEEVSAKNVIWVGEDLPRQLADQ
jgi:antitoxin component YwqK of YwqJK toxin-antitoxin module